MDVYIKQKESDQFYLAECLIIRAKKGDIRVLPLHVEQISSRKYYMQDYVLRIALHVCFSGNNEDFFANDGVFTPGTKEYNFFDRIAKCIR